IELKKTLGQNFLVNDGVIGRILELANIDGQLVLEVGPGIGTLTVALLKRAAGVISIERDPSLEPVLAQTAGASPHFRLLMGDAVKVTADEVARAAASLAQAGAVSSSADAGDAATAQTDAGPVMPTALVANLPYAVAATVVLDYLQRFPELSTATVMVQKEVADRMSALPGTKDYGAYTVQLQLIARPAGRFEVAPGNFMPAPHVDSTVIRLERTAPRCPDGSVPDDTVLAAAALAAKAAFAQRRKTIRNSMRGYLAPKGADLEALDTALEQAGIAPTLRGERLSVSDYLLLGKELVNNNVTPLGYLLPSA
ncbi:MAG: 16S rRNA (adenine(1518)-N(6)/adenine(1519)-N(6))-dimethyltransferase RsmA, partial [Coriobacteriales bacterium]|nr:16S rRNA (adenine(1518)-N(6)/adenine(1519)-N(6))-dimethyltransferase RsmA [Coriobacteriales bacterium]